MKKLLISLLAAAIFCTSVFASPCSAAVVNYSNSDYSDEVVTVIVQTEGRPLLSSAEAAEIGSRYLGTKKGKNHEENLLETQLEVMAEIEKEENLSLEIGYSYTAALNGFSIEVPKASIEKIKKLPNVKNVFIAQPIQLYLAGAVEQSGSLPSLTKDDAFPEGYSGEGQVIAIVDNEFDINHEFFSKEPKNPKLTKTDIRNTSGLAANINADYAYKSAKIPFAYNYANKSYDTYSSNNVIHGTHVAGIAAGKDGKFPDDTVFENDEKIESFSGVAPEAQLLLMRNANESGLLRPDWTLAAFEDAIKLGADVINASFGTDFYSADANPVYEEVLENIKNAGIVACLAAGNSGIGINKTSSLAENPDYSTSGTPSSGSNGTAIASVNNIYTLAKISNPSPGRSYYYMKSQNGGKIAATSSWGVTETLELKPEFAAPGAEIFSSAPRNQYKTMGGTSMAAPHASGMCALIGEYLNKNGINLSGSERVNRIENMLMSSAKIVYQENGVPYSPRVQGAGLANTAAAMKSPVILIGDAPKSKISLGDDLESEIELKFTVVNLSGEDVTFDKTSVIALTDGYKTNENGENVVGLNNSVALKIESSTLESEIKVLANSSKEISFKLTLNQEELEKNKEIFTNGFFIDGFVILEKEDDTIPEISLPFTGFYGDWEDAPSLDKTMYDEGGSTLYVEGKNKGTLLFTKVAEKIQNLGLGKGGKYDRERIAISPNGDGFGDELGIRFINLRTTKYMEFKLLDKNGETVDDLYFENVFAKYAQYPLNLSEYELQIENLPDGDYTFVYETEFNSENAKTESVSLPLTIDRELPIFTGVDLNGNILKVKAKDNHRVQHISITYKDSNGYDKSRNVITEEGDGKECTASFDISEINPETITLSASDCALNSARLALSKAQGDVFTTLADYQTSDAPLTVAKLECVNTTSNPINGDIVAAFLTDEGKLIKLDSKENITLDPKTKKDVTFTILENLKSASKIKVFLWNGNNLCPLDISKELSTNER